MKLNATMHSRKVLKRINFQLKMSCKPLYVTMALSLLQIVLVASLSQIVFGQGRINMGYPIDIEMAPYMAQVIIRLNETAGLACDGTILNELFILTAGHCTTDENLINASYQPLNLPSQYTIIVGTTYYYNGDQTGELLYVSKVYLREYTSNNDIGMLKLSSRITLDGITKRVALLPSSSGYYPESRTNVHVDGWGTNPQDPQTTHLYRADIYTLSKQECNYNEYQICTFGDNKAGPCQGDSGGPLLTTDGIQIGIVSFVPVPCTNQGGIMSTFTAVAANLDWIRQTINGENDGGQAQQPAPAPSYQRPTTTTRRPVFGFPILGK